MIEKVLDHVNDCCTSAWPHPLLVAPSVNPRDELRLDADIDVRGFAFHAGAFSPGASSGCSTRWMSDRRASSLAASRSRLSAR